MRRPGHFGSWLKAGGRRGGHREAAPYPSASSPWQQARVSPDFVFAKALADTYAVMGRGENVMAGSLADADEKAILRHMAI